MRYAFNIPVFLEWVVETWAPVRAQADQAAYSRSHFSRLFRSQVGETARSLKRRLQLEAGAHLLKSTEFEVGEVAVEVGYETPEAFAKAFRAAFGSSPSVFRKSNGNAVWLECASGIHFHPSGIIVRRQGEATMNLTLLLYRQHVDEVERLLQHAAKLNPKDLDRELVAYGDTIPWDRHERTVRDTLRSIIQTHVLWLAAFKSHTMPDVPVKPSVEALQEMHRTSGPELLEFVEEVEAKQLWASEFVDALCEEPVRFQFGAVLAHILVFGIHRRMLVLQALRELGVKGLEYGDPINWLKAQNGKPAFVPECV